MSILTVDELAEKLKVSRPTIYKLKDEGMPHFRVAADLRFNEPDVMFWLLNRKEY